MIQDLFHNLLTGWIGAILAWLALKTWNFYKIRFEQRYTKFTYFRVIRLRIRDQGHRPYYQRSHTSEGTSTDVYDEVWCMNSLHASKADQLQEIRLTSSGLVDAQQILPLVQQNRENHPHLRDQLNSFTCGYEGETTHLAAAGTLINGLQNRRDWWFGTTAQYDNQTLLLVVDFSSLPVFETPIKGVSTSIERDRKELSKSKVHAQWFEDRRNDRVFYVKFDSAKKGDAIKIHFDVNVAALDNTAEIEPLPPTVGSTVQPDHGPEPIGRTRPRRRSA